MQDIILLILLFLCYSVIGWIAEEIDILLISKKIVNRGFLIGPYCPIYGFGAVFIITFLKTYEKDPIVLFVMCMVSCAILEYMTSLVMEKIFRTRWWDYSNNKFNINGRICLETMVLFGIGGLIIIYFVNPLLLSIINKIPFSILNIVTIIFSIIFIIDVIVSCNIIITFKNAMTDIRKDSTDEIKKKVKNIILEKSKLIVRLEKAFPNYEFKMRKK